MTMNKSIIFTIGSSQAYQASINKHGTIFKQGKGKDYIGGYAFRTFEDAQRRIKEAYQDRDFIVWGIKADWNNDIYENPHGGNWHHLLIDAEIVPLLIKQSVTQTRMPI